MIKEYFPDGTPIDDWFYDFKTPCLTDLGKQYVLTDFNIRDDGNVYTNEFQSLIDLVYQNGGGVIVVPKGTYMTGSIFFKQGVNLYLSDGAILKGSDDINDYQIKETRIEGETCKYYVALINADNIDGFVISGNGIIDGNGMRSWKAFWKRRMWNPNCTNKDEQRPRLVYLSNCKNTIISNIKLINSHFWTNHIYKCNHIKFINLNIFSPEKPVKAPSTDAIDIDACSDILIKNCYLEVNDDAVALKGGKGPWADSDPNNGINERIIVEDCTYGFCHSCLTCGSEAIHNKNIIVRRINVKEGKNLLWLKMRPDTPQKYEYIKMSDIVANVTSFININPWTQFFDLKGRSDMPPSNASNIIIEDVKCRCTTFFNVKKCLEQYILSDFTFRNLSISAYKTDIDKNIIDNFTIENVVIDKLKITD